MQLLADEKRKEIGYVVFYAVLVFKKLWLKTHHTQYLLINAELCWYNYAKYSKPTFGVFNFWCNYLILAKKLPNLKIAFFADFYFIWSFEILIFFSIVNELLLLATGVERAALEVAFVHHYVF